MPTRRKRAALDQATSAPVEYLGKRTRTGNSTGFRFEGALFKSHPEFSGEVRAHVIAPGRLLVIAEPVESQGADPVIASFLAFLKQDMVSHPQNIRPFDAGLSREMASLVEGVNVSRDDGLGDDIVL